MPAPLSNVCPLNSLVLFWVEASTLVDQRIRMPVTNIYVHDKPGIAADLTPTALVLLWQSPALNPVVYT